MLLRSEALFHSSFTNKALRQEYHRLPANLDYSRTAEQKNVKCGGPCSSLAGLYIKSFYKTELGDFVLVLVQR